MSDTSPFSASKYGSRHGTTDTGTQSIVSEFKHKRRADYRAAAVEDMAHKAVRLGNKEFLDNFFPLPAEVSHEHRPQPAKDVFKKLADLEAVEKMTEIEVSYCFIEAINAANVVQSTLKLAESQHAPDKGDSARLKVDAAFFRPNFLPTDGRPHWADQMVSVEFKSHGTARDPYDDRVRMEPEADAIDRKKVRGQIIDYAEQVFYYQHRIALFMLIVIGRRFRCMRWDRSGTIVTPLVDYVEQSDVLFELLWRMSLANDEQLGLDPSAARVLSDDEDFERMDAAAKPQESDVDHTPRTLADNEVIPDEFIFRYVREDFSKSLAPEWPRYRLDVPDGTTMRQVLVGKPSFRSRGMAGRGTRGYVALDCKTGRFVWLKDAWRAHYELVDQEGAVLEKLNQTTQTPEFWKPRTPPKASDPLTASSPSGPLSATSSRTSKVPSLPSSKSLKRGISQVEESDTDATLPNGEPREECPLRRHKHYRIVVEEVCMPLVKFETGKQLLEIVLNCVLAHEEATVKAKIMHRDVSGGNIVILPRFVHDPETKVNTLEWEGVLVDWELSKPINAQDVPSRARQPERTGTWQYMSIATLNNHVKAVETSDELESFVYVILYHGVRYLRSNCTNVGSFIERFFDSYCETDGKYACGETKQNAMYDGQIRPDSTRKLLEFGTPIDDFLADALSYFKAFYAVLEYNKGVAKNAKAAAEPPRTSVASSSAFGGPAAIPQNVQRATRNRPTQRQLPPSLANRTRGAPRLFLIKPDAEQYTRAAEVQYYDWMVQALTDAIAGDWSKLTQPDRVEGDNVSKNYTPTGGLVGLVAKPTTKAASKKPRITGPSVSSSILSNPSTSSNSSLSRKPGNA